MITEFDRQVVRACKAAAVTWRLSRNKLRYAPFYDEFACACPLTAWESHGGGNRKDVPPDWKARMVSAADNHCDGQTFDPELRAYLLAALQPVQS